MPWFAELFFTAVAALLVAASAHDLAVRTVPNAMVAALAAVGLGLAVAEHRLLMSALVAVLMLAGGMLLCRRGVMGGGDAKLLAACALLVAPGQVGPMLLATALAGGVLCVPYLLGPKLLAAGPLGRPARLLRRLLRCERWRLRRGGPLPYAVAIAVGTLFVLLHKV